VGFFPATGNQGVTGNLTVTGTINAAAIATPPLLQLVARVDQFALQNGTPTIASWTAPNDGNDHTAFISGTRNVTVAETGGAISATWSPPGGGSIANVLAAGGSGTGQGTISQSGQSAIMLPGTTLTVAQSSALTAGTATCSITIWAS